MSHQLKAIFFSCLQVVAAAAAYYHLVTGGWLQTHYQWNDPNIVNLLLALFEPIALVSVLVYWLWPTAALYRVLVFLSLAQVLIALGIGIFFLIFLLLWHPRLM